MKKRFLITSISIFFLIANTYSQIIFDGFYAEVIYKVKGEKNAYLYGQYILDSMDFVKLISNPDSSFHNNKLNMIHNSSGWSYKVLGIKLPDSVKNYDEITWNNKISLYRGNDYDPYYLYRSNVNKQYVFFLKKINIKILNLKDIRNNISTSLFKSVDSPFLSAKNHFLLSEIKFQKYICEYDLVKMHLDTYLEILPRKKAFKYTPFCKFKNRKQKCNLPIDW